LRFCADKDMNHGSAQSINRNILVRLFASSREWRFSLEIEKSIEPTAFTSFKSHLTDLL
jgi:hypothetical protein